MTWGGENAFYDTVIASAQGRGEKSSLSCEKTENGSL